MKRLASLLLSAVMLFCVALSGVASVSAMQLEDIAKTRIGESGTYYEFDASTKTLTISGEGGMPDFRNDSVTQPWYDWRSDGSVESIVVEEGITSVGNYAFYSVGAANVTLPDSLVKIGSYAFSCNMALTSLHLGKGVTTIMNNAFHQCLGLEEINIPEAVASIGAGAFERCTALESVSFENMNMTVAIAKRAFLACSSLTRLDLPKGATVSSYAVGYTAASSGSINRNMTMGVFRDSAAYTFAARYFINYAFLDTMEIREGETISREYFSDSTSNEMNFTFIPKHSCSYTFSSDGDVDVDCVLKDSGGNVIAQSSDISINDLNFSITYQLNAGEQYCYTVTSIESTGAFTVALEGNHIMTMSVIEPGAYTDGYTIYTCESCGYGYQCDFVDCLAVNCSGTVYRMSSADGGYSEDEPLAQAVIYDLDGNELGTTDGNGCFELKAYRGIVISAPYGIDRRIELTESDNDLGGIAIVNCDYCQDGYINAKDFAVLKDCFGQYDEEDTLLAVMDTDGNGIIDADDFTYALEFVAYGKIDETLYADN